MPTPKSFTGFKSRYKSDFNPGVFEFERLDIILKNIDDLSFNVDNLNRDAILPFFSGVKQLFTFLRPFIYLSYTKRVLDKEDKEFEDLWLKVLAFHIEYKNDKKINYPLGLVKQIGDFHSKLLLTKQLVGFGLPMTKEESAKTTMRTYLKAGKRAKKDDRFNKGIEI